MGVSPLLQGFFLLAHAFMIGVVLGILGPSLPDLQCIYGVTLNTLSFLLLAFGLGGVSGQFLVPWLLRKVSTYMLLASLMSSLCVFFFALTYSGIYIAFILTFIAAVTGGCSLNVVLYMVNLLWPGNSKGVYLVFGFTALGSVISPLVLEPFLSDGIVTSQYRVNTFNDTMSLIQNHPSISRIEHRDNDTDTFSPKISSINVSVLVKNEVNASIALKNTCFEFLTLMQYPFLMFGLLSLPIIAVFIYFFIKEQNDPNEAPYLELRETKSSYKKTEYLYIGMMFLFFFQGQGFPTGYSALLPTFGTNGRLDISLSTMTFMTSLFWFSFLIARLVPCMFPKRISQLQILMGSVTGLTAGMVLLCLSLNNEVLLWVATFVTGLFTAPALPAGMAWVRETVDFTPVIRSVLLTGVAFGFVFPYITATLVSKFGTDVFPYAFLGFDLFSAIVLGIAIICNKLNQSKTHE